MAQIKVSFSLTGKGEQRGRPVLSPPTPFLLMGCPEHTPRGQSPPSVDALSVGLTSPAPQAGRALGLGA